MLNQLAGVFPLGLTLMFLWACGGSIEETQLDYPLSGKMTIFGTKEIFITTAEGVSLDSQCDLSGFGGLKPGMNLRQASALLGPPSTHYMEYGRDDVYVFNLDENQSVEIVRQMAGSDDPLIERWFLRRPIPGQRFEELVSKEVLEATPPWKGDFSVHINSGAAAASLKLKNGLVHQIWWLGPTDNREVSKAK